MLKSHIISLIKQIRPLGLIVFFAFFEAAGQLPAFPGAEGFGMYARGGRGGRVCHVTSLADDGSEGTLRHALSMPGPRTVVFDVSGTIFLTDFLQIPDSTTLAGQTAPGDGVCIAGYPVKLGSENIVRYLRFRPGNANCTEATANRWDGLEAQGRTNVIVDHCSVSWSVDECCSILGNRNTTLQWCIVSHSLADAGHAKGRHGYGGNWGGAGASFHHNLLAHHGSRAPRLGPMISTQLDERMDMRNNVVYNYGGNGCYGGEAMTVNIVANYYKPGPATPADHKGARIAAPAIRTRSYVDRIKAYRPTLHRWGAFYVADNVNPAYPALEDDNWGLGIMAQLDTTARATDGTWNDSIRRAIRLDRPMPFPPTTTHSAREAYGLVLAHAGASLHRDFVDSVAVADARSGTATFTGEGCDGGIINSERDMAAPGAESPWPTLRSLPAPADSDGDGIPDDWERARGLDPADPADGNAAAPSGYTMLEVYLNELCRR